MNLPTTLTCPLGSKCEEARDNVIHRCAWFIQVAGMNPQTGEQTNEWGCAMAWMPVLMLEQARVARGTSAAVEQMTSTNVTASTQLANALMTAAKMRRLEG